MAGGSGQCFEPSISPAWAAAPRTPVRNNLQPAAEQEPWDANGSLGMLNGAFQWRQRGKMRGERNFSFEVSLGENQTMVI